MRGPPKERTQPAKAPTKPPKERTQPEKAPTKPMTSGEYKTLNKSERDNGGAASKSSLVPPESATRNKKPPAKSKDDEEEPPKKKHRIVVEKFDSSSSESESDFHSDKSKKISQKKQKSEAAAKKKQTTNKVDSTGVRVKIFIAGNPPCGLTSPVFSRDAASVDVWVFEKATLNGLAERTLDAVQNAASRLGKIKVADPEDIQFYHVDNMTKTTLATSAVDTDFALTCILEGVNKKTGASFFATVLADSGPAPGRTSIGSSSSSGLDALLCAAAAGDVRNVPFANQSTDSFKIELRVGCTEGRSGEKQARDTKSWLRADQNGDPMQFDVGMGELNIIIHEAMLDLGVDRQDGAIMVVGKDNKDLTVVRTDADLIWTMDSASSSYRQSWTLTVAINVIDEDNGKDSKRLKYGKYKKGKRKSPWTPGGYQNNRGSADVEDEDEEDDDEDGVDPRIKLIALVKKAHHRAGFEPNQTLATFHAQFIFLDKDLLRTTLEAGEVTQFPPERSWPQGVKPKLASATPTPTTPVGTGMGEMPPWMLMQHYQQQMQMPPPQWLTGMPVHPVAQPGTPAPAAAAVAPPYPLAPPLSPAARLQRLEDTKARGNLPDVVYARKKAEIEELL